MTQEHLRGLIRDLHHTSHQLAEIRCGIHGEDGKRLEAAKNDLTQIRVAMIELLDDEY